MIQTTPPGKVPLWFRVLFPGLRGLGENPLFIRWSAQGFHRKPKWWRSYSPIELRRTGGIVWDILGVAGVLLVASMVAVSLYHAIQAYSLGASFPFSYGGQSGVVLALTILGLALMVIRLGGTGSFSAASRLVRNCDEGAWGADLYFTSLEPIEYDRALFGALTVRMTRRLFALFVGATAVACAGVFMANYRTAADLPPIAGGMAAAVAVAAAVFGQIFIFVVMRLALSCSQAREGTRHGALGVILNEMVIVPPYALSLAPGFFTGFIWAVAVVAPLGLIPKHPWIAASGGAVAFAAPNVVFGVFLTRFLLDQFRGALGKAFLSRFDVG